MIFGLTLSMLLFVVGAGPADANSAVWGKLFIKTDPPNADISFLYIKYAYRDGIILRKGTYTVKVDYPGYETTLKEVDLQAGVDNVVEISLRRVGEPMFAPQPEPVPMDVSQPEPLPLHARQPEPLPVAQPAPVEDKRISLSEVGRRDTREETARPPKSESELKARSMLLQPWSYKKDTGKETKPEPEPAAEALPVAPQPAPQPAPNVTQYPPLPQAEPAYQTGYSGQLGGEQTKVMPEPDTQEPWQATIPPMTPSIGEQTEQPSQPGVQEPWQASQQAALPPMDTGTPPSPQELTQVGLHLTSAGDLENALHAFTLALQQQPDNQVALRGRAFCHYHLGNNDMAMLDLNNLLARFPTDPLGFFHRGNVHLLNGDPEAALDDYNRALGLEQSLPDLYNGRGTAYYNLGRYFEAVQDYDLALNADPNYVDAYYNRGSALMKLDKYQLALDDFDRALKLRPEDAQAQQKRKQAQKALRRY